MTFNLFFALSELAATVVPTASYQFPKGVLSGRVSNPAEGTVPVRIEFDEQGRVTTKLRFQYNTVCGNDEPMEPTINLSEDTGEPVKIQWPVRLDFGRCTESGTFLLDHIKGNEWNYTAPRLDWPTGESRGVLRFWCSNDCDEGYCCNSMVDSTSNGASTFTLGQCVTLDSCAYFTEADCRAKAEELGCRSFESTTSYAGCYYYDDDKVTCDDAYFGSEATLEQMEVLPIEREYVDRLDCRTTTRSPTMSPTSSEPTFQPTGEYVELKADGKGILIHRDARLVEVSKDDADLDDPSRTYKTSRQSDSAGACTYYYRADKCDFPGVRVVSESGKSTTVINGDKVIVCTKTYTTSMCNSVWGHMSSKNYDYAGVTTTYSLERHSLVTEDVKIDAVESPRGCSNLCNLSGECSAKLALPPRGNEYLNDQWYIISSDHTDDCSGFRSSGENDSTAASRHSSKVFMAMT